MTDDHELDEPIVLDRTSAAKVLKAQIEEGYGEPEQEYEHCNLAETLVFDYMDENGYTEDDMTDGAIDTYDLYLYTRFLCGEQQLTKWETCIH